MGRNKDIALQFIEIAPLMIRTVKGEVQKVAEGRLTHPQYRILAQIDRGVNTVSQIANQHGVSQPAMSKMVQALVVRGLIERSTQAGDRRQAILKLTKKGHSLFRELKGGAAELLGKRLESISTKELRELEEALSSLEKILKNSPLLKEARE